MSVLDTERLDARVGETMEKARIPALSLAVVHEGEVVHARGYGVTSVEDGALPVTPTTLFRIASTTKAMVATVLLQLVGDGRIDLDAPVREYVPWFTLSEPAAAAAVTVRHVMAGLSGLPADNDTEGGGRAPDALERFVRDHIPRYPLVADPGKVFVYSNPAINVAGYVAEVVSGIRFDDLVRQRLFEPLEMERSTFDPLVAMTYPLALPHHVDDAGVQGVTHRVEENRAEHPSGGAYSTALEMANYARMLLDGGRFNGRQVLGERQLADMTTPQTRTFWPFSPATSYGLMLYVNQYKGRERWGHPGGAWGYIHTFELMPETRSAVIFQANAGGTFDGLGLADAIFDELLGLPADWAAPTVEPDPADWEAYVGTYANDTALYEGASPVGTVVVGIVDGSLVVDQDGIRTILQPFGPHFFRAAPAEQTVPGSGIQLMGFYREPEEGQVEWVSVNLQPARRVS